MTETIDVFWVTSVGNTGLEADPLFRLIHPVPHVTRVEVLSGDLVESLADSVETLVNCSLQSGRRCVVMIDAFLKEALSPGFAKQQSPHSGRTANLRPHDVNGLKSVKLMWALWLRIRGRAPIWITTDGYQMDRDSEFFLEAAVTAGVGAAVYGWETRDVVLGDILRGVQP